ncbi:MAG: UvrB/UvrC motif-containing protein, partial [Microvirga sp.]
LDFEEAARLRDELKRLQATELAISDDPLARQTDVEREAGRYKGSRKYGASANLPPTARGGDPAEAGQASDEAGPAGRGISDEGTRIRKPTLDEMGPGTDREVPMNFRERPLPRSTQGHGGQKPKYKGRKGR